MSVYTLFVINGNVCLGSETPYATSKSSGLAYGKKTIVRLEYNSVEESDYWTLWVIRE